MPALTHVWTQTHTHIHACLHSRTYARIHTHVCMHPHGSLHKFQFQVTATFKEIIIIKIIKNRTEKEADKDRE